MCHLPYNCHPHSPKWVRLCHTKVACYISCIVVAPALTETRRFGILFSLFHYQYGVVCGDESSFIEGFGFAKDSVRADLLTSRSLIPDVSGNGRALYSGVQTSKESGRVLLHCWMLVIACSISVNVLLSHIMTPHLHVVVRFEMYHHRVLDAAYSFNAAVPLVFVGRSMSHCCGGRCAESLSTVTVASVYETLLCDLDFFSR